VTKKHAKEQQALSFQPSNQCDNVTKKHAKEQQALSFQPSNQCVVKVILVRASPPILVIEAYINNFQMNYHLLIYLKLYP
jgi:hypothetical protein